MKRVLLSVAARQDRIDLWMYVAIDNPAAADRLIDELDEKLLLLANSPNLGRAQSRIGPGVRQFPIGSYLIFYTPEPGGIKVLRVLHGARRLEDLL